MRINSVCAAVLCFSFSFGFAQTSSMAVPSENQVKVSVPRLIKLTGIISETDGQPRIGTVGLMLAIYKDQQGGAALWQESQNVTLDASGHYTLLLGANSTDGLPLELFASEEARWLGIQVQGETEQPRTLFVAVPYALKAADAETLGGKPASAFLTSEQIGPSVASATQSRIQTSVVSGGTPLSSNVTGSGSQNVLPKFDSSGTNLVNSLLFDDGTHVGVGTQSPTFGFDEQNTDASAAGANLFRIQTPSVNGATMHFISTSANGRHFGFGSNFILGVGEFGIYDYTSGAARVWIDAAGTVGVGTFGGGGNFTRPTFTLDVQNTDASSAGQHIFRLQTPSTNGAVMHLVSTSANGHDWAFGSNFIVGAGEFGVYDYTANASRLFITGTGNIGIGSTSPAATLDVNGVVRAASGFKFGDGSTQTSAAVGTLTGVTTAAGSGLTGGGTSGTLALSLASCTNGQVLQFNGSAWVCTTPAGNGGVTLPFSGSVSSASGGFAVNQTNSTVLQNNPTFQQAMTSIPAGIAGFASTTSNTAVGVVGLSQSISSPAIVGWNGSTSGSNDSANGILALTDNPLGTALEGTANSTTGNTVGIHAKVRSSSGIAFMADTPSGTGTAGQFNGSVQTGPLTANSSQGNSVAGQFNGNVNITGMLTKGGGTFKIDDPLEPTHKYLSHSFVESPDMMNIYNGIVVLNAKGEAWITMPDWFEALNMDFRYQLTSMGRPAPNLYIAREVSRNHFKIAGGSPRGKVSWQVTGIRHDAWADAHRVQVEEVKPPAEQGTYLHPELFVPTRRGTPGEQEPEKSVALR